MDLPAPTSSKKRPVRVEIKGDNRIIGYIKNGDTFITRKTHAEDHFMRKYQGFGIAYTPFKNILLPNVEKIKIIYDRKDGTNDLYVSSPETWKKRGTVAKEGGFEKQIFLGIKQMNKLG